MSSASSQTNAKLKAILKAGKLFEGKYRIMRPLGAGSFAVVVHARHEVMERDVALKFLKPKVVASSPEVSERFVKEVQIASRLTHPNVVAIYDFGVTDDGIYYMVQEYVSGKTVDEVFLGRDEPLEIHRIQRMMQQVLSCLEEAHSQGVIHRDLKPSNLMLTTDEEGQEVIKILDFGVAKLLEKDEHGVSTSGRQSTKFIGTPIYMSPEQILGKEVMPASDLYSTGLMLYEMLTGDPPIDADQIAEVVQLHLSEKPFAFRKLKALPPVMQRAILQATHRNPEKRFQSAAQFAAALRGEKPKVSADQKRAKEEAPPKASTSSNGDDIFSGRNYIAIPEDMEEEFNDFKPLPFERQHRDRLEPPTEAPAPVSVPEPRSADTSSSSGLYNRQDLELDMDAMRSVRKRYTNIDTEDKPTPPRAAPISKSIESNVLAKAPTAPKEPSKVFGWVLWGGLLCLLSFINVMVVGALVTVGHPIAWRVGAGVLPLIGGVIWFGSEQLLYKEERNYLRALSIRILALTAFVLVFSMLIIPGYAAQTMRVSTASLFHPAGEAEAGPLLYVWTQSALHGLGEVCAVFARLVPWG